MFSSLFAYISREWKCEIRREKEREIEMESESEGERDKARELASKRSRESKIEREKVIE